MWIVFIRDVDENKNQGYEFPTKKKAMSFIRELEEMMPDLEWMIGRAIETNHKRG